MFVLPKGFYYALGARFFRIRGALNAPGPGYTARQTVVRVRCLNISRLPGQIQNQSPQCLHYRYCVCNKRSNDRRNSRESISCLYCFRSAHADAKRLRLSSYDRTEVVFSIQTRYCSDHAVTGALEHLRMRVRSHLF